MFLSSLFLLAEFFDDFKKIDFFLLQVMIFKMSCFFEEQGRTRILG